MNNLTGLILFVASSTLAGALLGGLFGLSSTAINNSILNKYFDAAIGSYRWWAMFHLYAWAIGFGLIALSWGLLLIYKSPTAPGTMG